MKGPLRGRPFDSPDAVSKPVEALLRHDWRDCSSEIVCQTGGRKAAPLWSAWLQDSAAKYMGTALFWVVMQRVVVIPYRRFGTASRCDIACVYTVGMWRLHRFGMSSSYSTTNKMHLFLKLFILVKLYTCFGRSFRPSSGAQNCTYGNRHMSNSCCYLLLAGTLAAGKSSCLTYGCCRMSSFELLMMDGKTVRNM